MKNELTWALENSCLLLGMERGEEACSGDLQSIPESEGTSRRERGLPSSFAARTQASPGGLRNPLSFYVLIFYVVLRGFL